MYSTLGIEGLQTGTRLPDILLRFWLMNSSGLGPTMRWIRSMLFSKGGIALVNVPKLFASDCKTRRECQNNVLTTLLTLKTG